MSQNLMKRKSLLEESAERFENVSACKLFACDNSEMQNDVQLKECTYYLIQLFYKTGKKYSCTQTKLGKMLSILAFNYARHNQTLFVTPIYRYAPRCGTLIKALTFIPKDVYSRDLDQPNPDNCQKINDIFDDTVVIRSPYDETNHLSAETKTELEELFRTFGAYPANVLGDLLNPIVDHLVDSQSDVLGIEKLEKLDPSLFSADASCNTVVKYIFSL